MTVAAPPQPAYEFAVRCSAWFVRVGKQNVIVGRASDCDLVLGGADVSRRHAVLRRVGNRIVIDDLGSANGVCVNGRLIAGPTVLDTSDEIVIGEHILRIEVHRADAFTETTQTIVVDEDLQSRAIDEALREQRFDDAARLIERRLELVDGSIKAGIEIHRPVLDRSFDQVLWVGQYLRRPTWLTWFFDACRQRCVVLTARQVDAVHLAVRDRRWLPDGELRRAVERYLSAMELVAEQLPPADRFSLNRVHTLVRTLRG